jgi:nitrogen-specific signal transduction histidine kinase
MVPPVLSSNINGLREPALLIDPAGTVIAANLAASRLWRLSSTKIVGEPLITLFSDDPEKLTRYLRRCSQNSKGTLGELRILPLRGQGD